MSPGTPFQEGHSGFDFGSSANESSSERLGTPSAFAISVRAVRFEVARGPEHLLERTPGRPLEPDPERREHRGMAFGQAVRDLDLGQGLLRLCEELLVIHEEQSATRRTSRAPELRASTTRSGGEGHERLLKTVALVGFAALAGLLMPAPVALAQDNGDMTPTTRS